MVMKCLKKNKEQLGMTSILDRVIKYIYLKDYFKNLKLNL